DVRATVRLASARVQKISGAPQEPFAVVWFDQKYDVSLACCDQIMIAVPSSLMAGSEGQESPDVSRSCGVDQPAEVSYNAPNIRSRGAFVCVHVNAAEPIVFIANSTLKVSASSSAINSSPD